MSSVVVGIFRNTKVDKKLKGRPTSICNNIRIVPYVFYNKIRDHFLVNYHTYVSSNYIVR